MVLLTDGFWPDLCFLLFVFWTVAYIYATRNFNFWMKIGVPFMKPIPFFGNFMDVVLCRQSVGQLFKNFYHEHEGKDFVGLFAFDQPILLVRDPELVEHILVKDSPCFPSRNISFAHEVDFLCSKNIFGMNGERWKIFRRKLTPTFTSGKMKCMFELMNEIGLELASYFEIPAALGKPVMLEEKMSAYTVEVALSCVFGTKRSLKDPCSPLHFHLLQFRQFSISRIIKFAAYFFIPTILKIFHAKAVDKDFETFIHEIIKDNVTYLKNNNLQNGDLLDFLIQLKKKGQIVPKDEQEYKIKENENLTADFKVEGDQLVAQCFKFLMEGFGMSSQIMSFTLYHLALNPELQCYVREEVQQHINPLTYKAVLDMKLLDMVVNETLRMYPVISFLDRRTSTNYKLPGTDTVIPKDTCIIIPIWGLQMDPVFHPEPNHYKPERFSDINKMGIHNYTYMPFGEGPHNCIGMELGLLQTKVGIAHILSRFSVQPCEETPIPLSLNARGFILSSEKGFPICFEKLD